MAVKIFFCYAHEDEKLLNKLKAHLKALQRQGLIDTWHDRDIDAGSEWEQEIDMHLNEAQIILLLVSRAFMNSDYCYSVEMKRAMERHEQRVAHVIPVIIRPVHWRRAPFGKLQALPKDAKPIIDWPTQDHGFKNVVEGIDYTIQQANVISTEKESKAWALGKAHETPFWIEEQMASGRAGLTWIISGGQTGADCAALDWVLAHGKRHGIKQGGWCPHGRQAEDGPIDNRFRLKETLSDDYSQRTQWNVYDSDGTVIFSIAPELYGGSKLTEDYARQVYKKPCLHINRATSNPADKLRDFLHQNDIHILNIAGPRAEKTEVKVGEFVKEVLKEALG